MIIDVKWGKKTTEERKTKSIFNRFDKKVNLCGGQNLKDKDKHIINEMPTSFLIPVGLLI